LICLDDLQWADGGTLAAMRSLPGALDSLSIGWVFAAREGQGPPALTDAIRRLDDLGAERIVLTPLDRDAVARDAHDIMRAELDEAFLEPTPSWPWSGSSMRDAQTGRSPSVSLAPFTPQDPMAEFPAPKTGFVATHFIVVGDVERSRRYYTEVLGGETVRTGDPGLCRAGQQLDHHQRRGRSDRRQADGHARDSTGPQPDQRETEIRCYIRDPDGHLIEVGQTTRPPV
jgi:hypothetical protein